jgi:hypothetical protein
MNEQKRKTLIFSQKACLNDKPFFDLIFKK